MAKQNPGNIYDQNRVVGSQGQKTQRAMVIDVMDPEKTHRVKIRVTGHMDDQTSVPDEKLPWVKVMNGTQTPSMQTATQTHGVMPGAMVMVDPMGTNGQDFIIHGTVPNDEKEQNQSGAPAAQGKGQTDLVHTAEQYKNKTYGWSQQLANYIEMCKTTQQAEQIRKDGRKQKLTAEPVKESQDKADTPQQYGGRKAAKDAGESSGTIGSDKYNQGDKDAQQFIKDTINNRSAAVPNALDAMQNLKKVEGCPDSKECIGQGNFQQIMSQLASLFGGGGGGGQQEQANNEPNTEPSNTTPDPLYDLVYQLANQVKNGDVTIGYAAEDIDYGQLCYFGPDGKYHLASANDADTAPALTMALEDIPLDKSGPFSRRGEVTKDVWSWANGDTLYLGVVPGTIQNTAPDDIGQVIQVIAVAIDSDTIYFNPSLQYTLVT